MAQTCRGNCMATFDGVVVGAGHNGLTLAAYLARAGMKIAVVERNGKTGGGTSPEKPPPPGSRLNLHPTFFMGMAFCPLTDAPALYRYGFSYTKPPVQQAAVFRDGTGIVIHKDV